MLQMPAGPGKDELRISMVEHTFKCCDWQNKSPTRQSLGPGRVRSGSSENGHQEPGRIEIAYVDDTQRSLGGSEPPDDGRHN